MRSKDKKVLDHLNAALHRRTIKSALKKKQRNIKNNKPDSLRPDSKPSRNQYTNRIVKQELNVGTSFSVMENPLNIIQLLDTIENRKTKNKHITNIHLDLSRIKIIDIGAISILLSKVNQISLGRKRIKFTGNFPFEQQCEDIFKESGFLDYMRDVSGRKFAKQSDNYLVRIGSDKTKNEDVGFQIKKAMAFLTGREVHFPPVFSIIQEMCSNSVEHSSKNNKNWLLGVNYTGTKGDSKSYVTFTMTDMGYGILKTLKRKFGTKIRETMVNKKDPEILYRAFEKKYDSATGEVNRNKGLPLILDRYNNQYIKQLKVLTNNVYLDLDDQSKSNSLDQNFKGTFYCWTIDLTCIELWNRASIN